MTEELFREDAYLKSCDATVTRVNDLGGILLDRSVFYPTGGGQAGDKGVLRLASGEVVEIVTTVKGDGAENVVHVPAEGAPTVAPGDAVVAALDWDARYALMRMHTCLHLLCAAVPYGVTGGQINATKSRLDFDIGDGSLNKDAITAEINRLIAEDHPVSARWITDAELDANPELVRTMSVQPPRSAGKVRLLDIDGVDLQPCGGTHLARTGEIGKVRVSKIENKGKRNRRVNIVFDN
ncbi:MAG: alanyl-tRNA editing protein [Rhodospirillaceae bacterium]|jgi:misacylated tRNA(Ala) deacylase|nr:alanyl-tRNA editing protein [Rhodospirillaceae bacterium]